MSGSADDKTLLPVPHESQTFVWGSQYPGVFVIRCRTHRRQAPDRAPIIGAFFLRTSGMNADAVFSEFFGCAKAI